MTVLTLYRAPRNIVRRLLKPAALWLNGYRFKQSENEIYRLREMWNDLKQLEGCEYRHQVKLLQQRREVEGW